MKLYLLNLMQTTNDFIIPPPPTPPPPGTPVDSGIYIAALILFTTLIVCLKLRKTLSE